MEIQTNNTFKAKFIKPIEVQKLNPKTKIYSPEQVSFVEIEPENFEDVWALSQAARNWYPEEYASNIAYTATLLFKNTRDRAKNKIYAVTTQTKDFSRLDEFKLLAMAEIEKTDTVELEHIQVKPTLTNKYTDRAYKNIGTKILEVLKSLYNNIHLTAARGSVKNFYLKNGFICSDPDKNRFIWKK